MGRSPFPPPHSFYGAHESIKSSATTITAKTVILRALGIRQAGRKRSEFLRNFALTSAQPGLQQMPVFSYVSPAGRRQAALTYTRGIISSRSRLQIMGSHYHGHGAAAQSGQPDNRLNDVESMKAVGVLSWNH